MKREIRQARLRKLIDEVSEGNISDFARKVDKDQNYISKMLYPEDKKGAKPFGEKMARDICIALGLPEGWFDSTDGLPEKLAVSQVVIDVLNVSASAGYGSTSDLVEVVSQLRYVPEQYHEYYRGMNPDTVRVINVKGDSMYPTFQHGDLLFIDIDSNFFDGDGVYVFTYDNHTYVKRLQKTGKSLCVISDNAKYKEWNLSPEEVEGLFIHGKVKVHQSQKLNFIG